MKTIIFCLSIFCMFNFLSAQITITGHRGAAGYAPENTLSAIKKGLALGVDRIEIDVQQSKDGVVILMHDKTLKRTTNGKGYIRNKTWAELSQLVAPAEFAATFPNEKIPTLEEALLLINGKAQFVIEIKDGNSYYPNIEQHIVDLIHQYNAHKWCIIHSFNDAALEKIHELDATLPLHKLFVSGLGKDLKKWDYVQEFSVNEHFVSKKMIEKVHALGKKINVWTVNDKAKMQELITMGVDGIITNFPDVKFNGFSKPAER